MTHRITHERAPLRWEEGLPLGNGRAGVMLWGDGAPLRLTLDHADLWDLRINDAFRADPDYTYAGLRRLIAEGRFGEAVELFEARERRDNPLAPTKISIGRAEVRVAAGGTCRMSLDIDRALVEGRLGSESAGQDFVVFAHRDRDLICLRGVSDEPPLRLVPLAEMTPGMADLGHPSPTLTQDGDVRVMAQELIDGPCCAVAWCTSGSDTFVAVELAPERSEAVGRAAASVLRAREQGFDALLREHLAAWESFWAGSAVHLPEQRMELLWYYGVYLLACSSRPGASPPGLQGVWAMDGVMPPWRGDYHADMNVQETFWPACCSGHLELLDSWCDRMRALLPESRALTRRFFGTEGSFWPCCSVPEPRECAENGDRLAFRSKSPVHDPRGERNACLYPLSTRPLTSVQCWYTVQFAWSSVGWLAWLVWLRWRYSLDTRWLTETGYPIVSDILRFYRANVEEQADGYLHVPLSTSPEYRENKPEAWCQDPAIDLALIRRCCDWVVEMEDALGLDDLKTSARALRERLAPYPLTEGKVLCLWPGKPLDESHRHPSHLMAIHPAMDLTVEGTEEARQIIAASVEHFLSLGQYRWAGHTYAQMVSFAAVLGRAGWAYDCLRQFAEHWIGQNGLHFNADLALSGMSCFRYAPGAYGPFTMEANCGIAAGIGDMLVQGWNDRLRIFPAVPDHWREIAFRDLLTEGAFRVSAIRQAGRTVWVRVRATVERTLRLRDPFAGEKTIIEGCDVRREGDDLVADLQAGQAVTFAARECSLDLDQAAEAVRSADTSRLGLRAT